MKQFIVKEDCADISGYVRFAHFETYIRAESEEEALKEYRRQTKEYDVPLGDIVIDEFVNEGCGIWDKEEDRKIKIKEVKEREIGEAN